MLKIILPPKELYNEEKEEFFYMKEQEIQLEHSLVSVSKWEAKWCKPFLDKKNKTDEETIDYIKAMTISQNLNPIVYFQLNKKIMDEIADYINAPMTATIIKESKEKSREIITSEIIYYWMISFNIPFECQKWHLNRLLTLINVCSIKNQPAKKMSKNEILRRNKALNEARKAKLGTRG